LSPIETIPRQNLKVLVLKLLNLTPTIAYAFNEQLPNVALGLGAQFFVAKRDVNTALERIVKRLDTVRREKQDALEVLEQAQEYGHKGIAVYILVLPLLKEHIGLV
jgi:hypothetical protein